MEETGCTPGQQLLKQTVLDAGLCTGCGACAELCPYQRVYHDRTVSLFDCDLAEGRCAAYCPRTPTDLEGLRRELFDPADLTPEIGACKGFYITRAADGETRDGAQHGGTVSALVRLAMEEGLIDQAVLSEGGDDLLPQPVLVSDPAEVARHAGSRMVATPMVAAFNRACAEPGGRLGVVATPCQALALAKMRMRPLDDDRDPASRLGLTVGVFCGWAFDWRELSRVLAAHMPLAEITGMDIPPSKYHLLEVYGSAGTVPLNLDEVTPAVRNGCHYCADMTGEFSDIAVGSARLDEGWDTARGWNQVIVRSERGAELLELARSRGVLEFHEVPAGNLERLKRAALNKKRTAVTRLIERSGSVDDLGYLDAADPVLGPLAREVSLSDRTGA